MPNPVTLVKIIFEICRPWAVGAMPYDSDEVDLPVLLGAQQRPYVPATSLVGSLRRHLNAGGLDAARWLGPDIGPAGVPTNTGTSELVRTPSPMIALGTRLDGIHQLADRATTRICAVRGAASARALRLEHRVDVSPGQARLWWFVSLDAEQGAEEVTSLIKAVRGWQPFIGRGRSKGMGLARVENVQAISLDLDRPGDLTWWLNDRLRWFLGESDFTERVVLNEAGQPLRPAAGLVTFSWLVVDPLAVGSGTFEARSGGEVRIDGTIRRQGQTSALRRDAATGRPVIPATAWKGIFRHRVEFILAAIGCTDPEIAFHRDRLFGRASEHADGTQEGRLGILRFLDAPLVSPSGDEPDIWRRSHVGIDRFTGGAEPGKLFRVAAVAPGARAKQVIEYEPHPDDHDWQDTDRRLLAWVARDIHDGLVGLGGLTTRGYGTLRLEERSYSSLAPGTLSSAEFALPQTAGAAS